MQNPTRPVDNESGFGLLGVLLAMGVATILFLGILDILYVAANAQRATQIKAERAIWLTQLANVLSHDPTCTPSLQGNHPQGALTVLDPSDSAKVLAQAAQKFPGWIVDSVELENPRNVDPAMKLHAAEVVLKLRHPFKLIGVSSELTRELATIYYTVDAGRISRCFGTTNWASVGKSYCATLGGSWSDSAIQCTLPTIATAPAPTLTVAQVAAEPAQTSIDSNGAAQITTGVLNR